MKLPALKSQQGFALLTVVMVTAILLPFVGSALLSSGLTLKSATNLKSRNSAFYIADTGMQHAWQELEDGDGTSDFGAVFNAPSTPVLIFANVGFGGGSYTVEAEPMTGSNPNRVKLVSTGCLPPGSPCPVGNSKVVLLTQFEQALEPRKRALTTNGGLKISGNPSIMGTCGAAHSNAPMLVSGNPAVQMADGLTASGTMDISGNPCIGSADCVDSPPPEPYVLDTQHEKDAYEASHDAQPNETISPINPADFAGRVALASGGYILHSDGKVTVGGSCGTDGLCSGGTEVAAPTGWEYGSNEWKVSGNAAANGIFYVETAVQISGNPGTAASPWQATIIARDSIQWSGNPYVKPFPATDEQLQGILMVSGNDIKISGNVGLEGNGGAILAHQQINISGNPDVHGFAVAGDGQPTWADDPFPTSASGTNLISASEYGDVFSGNPMVHFDCTVQCKHPACRIPVVKMVAGTWADRF